MLPENANKRFLSVATASTGGTYYPMGVGLANIWSNHLKNKHILAMAIPFPPCGMAVLREVPCPPVYPHRQSLICTPAACFPVSSM
ncbi:hypothetical protein XBO1_1310002 [Xenorhabdus bovienii str. oregonense]|uniref:Uncharacterized protein n=1 Tax=Xenorhabdus bovienii str. oregonense TaxID=1398202 RepID=A0A077P1X0_XENBV|nr:hypothetical protein XBO1_1310002 [Xenorhabdus bovienii str. oregonense]